MVLLLRPLLLATRTTVPLDALSGAKECTVRPTVVLTVAFRADITDGPTDERNTPVEIQLEATGSRAKVLFVKMTSLIPLPEKLLASPDNTRPVPDR